MSEVVYKSVNPFTGDEISERPALGDNELVAVLAGQADVNSRLASSSLRTRVTSIERLAHKLEEAKSEIALTITREMGKPLRQSIAEIDKCIWLCNYAVAHAVDIYLERKQLRLEDADVVISIAPLGTVLGIMPWNFPIWQTLRYTVPALLNGNPVYLKPAPNVLTSSLMLEECIAESTSDPDLFRILAIDIDQIEGVIAHHAIAAVTLTGSTRSGSAVAALAGKYLKPSVLELGGSDPFIVLEDANVAKAATTFIDSRMNNTGQTCIAAKRAIVHQSVFDEFIDIAKAYLLDHSIGDPLENSTDISCIARSDLSEFLDTQIFNSKNGVETILEAERKQESNVFIPGLYLVSDLQTPLWREEVFGPVGALVQFESENEAISLANDTRYGLGCSIWSGDKDKAKGIARWIKAGSIHINRMVSSDPRVPFGGVKDSGYGRELGRDGFLELSNKKSITISRDS